MITTGDCREIHRSTHRMRWYRYMSGLFRPATRHVSLLQLVLILFQGSKMPGVGAYPFADVSSAAGLKQYRVPLRKYGGAVVADLDGDGRHDLLLGHHDSRPAELYFNNGNGTFVKAPWRFFHDIHGFTPFPFAASSRSLAFLVSVGGAYGQRPASPELFRVYANRTVVRLGDIGYGWGRGRSAVVVDLGGGGRRTRAWNDLFILNAVPADAQQRKNFVATVTNTLGILPRRAPALDKDLNSFAAVTDVDGDGRPELVTFPELRVYRVMDYFRAVDVTSTVVPPGLGRLRGVRAVAELDFDNDGWMDLMVVRTVENDLFWLRKVLGGGWPRDMLLRNVGGRYEDVSDAAGIPAGGESSGVTVADFNNDGWIDLLITQYSGQDRLLLNNRPDSLNGRVTFRQVPHPGYKTLARSDHPTAFDYDLDGRVDLLLSQGDWFDARHGAHFRLLRNTSPLRNDTSWLLISVGASPATPKVSAANAVVSVHAGSLQMHRRVGSPGTATGTSYINTVHFGLGARQWARKVSVRWTDGVVQTKVSVRAGRLIKFGHFASS